MSDVAAEPLLNAGAQSTEHRSGNEGAVKIQRPHVVVVDDDETMLEILARYLTHVGFDVTTCDSGQEVDALLEMTSIDLLISDLNMPHDGASVITRTRSRYPDLPVIVVTGRPIREADQAVIDTHVSEIFEKPTPLSDLARAVARLTGSLSARFSG